MTAWILVVLGMSMVGPFFLMGIVASPILVVLSLALVVTKRLRWFGLIGLAGWIPSLWVLAGVGPELWRELNETTEAFLEGLKSLRFF